MKRSTPPDASPDPFRKRSFTAHDDVALMLHAWEQDHPGTLQGWFYNAALRDRLTKEGYAGAKLKALKKEFA